MLMIDSKHKNIVWQVDDLLKWDENFYTSQLGGKNLTELQLRPGRYLNGSLIADDSFAGSKYALGKYQKKKNRKTTCLTFLI